MAFEFKKKFDKKYKIKGRTVEVISDHEISGKVRRFLKREIFLFCKNYKTAAYFPYLRFYLTNKLFKDENFNYPQMGVRLSIWPTTIIINLEVLIQLSGFKTIYNSLAHEIGHLRHNQINDIFKIREKIDEKLGDSFYIQKYYLDWHAKKEINLFNLNHLRSFFRGFIELINSEGIATFCQYSTKGVKFDERTFNHTYDAAKEGAEIAIELIESHYTFIKENIDKKEKEEFEKEFDEFTKKLHHITYNIGYHVIYSIIYFDSKITLEDAFKLKLYQSFRKYESLMLSNDKDPIITISSRKGIIDYNKLLAELQVVIRKIIGRQTLISVDQVRKTVKLVTKNKDL
jgi:hypothetical protein